MGARYGEIHRTGPAKPHELAVSGKELGQWMASTETNVNIAPEIIAIKATKSAISVMDYIPEMNELYRSATASFNLLRTRRDAIFRDIRVSRFPASVKMTDWRSQRVNKVLFCEISLGLYLSVI